MSLPERRQYSLISVSITCVQSIAAQLNSLHLSQFHKSDTAERSNLNEIDSAARNFYRKKQLPTLSNQEARCATYKSHTGALIAAALYY